MLNLSSIRSLHPDDFFFFPPQSEIKINSNANEATASVLLELK